MPKFIKTCNCPRHLLKERLDDIKECMKENLYDQTISLLLELKNNYSEDEKVQEIVAYYLFHILLNDKSKTHLELMKYIFKKAENNFLNSDLCIPVLSILLLINTATKDKVVKSMYKRMKDMDKNKLEKFLNKLPKDKIKRFK
jgi:hypothetical protein